SPPKLAYYYENVIVPLSVRCSVYFTRLRTRLTQVSSGRAVVIATSCTIPFRARTCRSIPGWDAFAQ
ncbi:MAG: hypothetical protein ACKO96_08130, partial [Flammeovirgaceae bacterium]